MPNGMAVARAAGGALLGAGMAANMVDPATAVYAAAGLAATDAEGSVIVATRKFPRLQEKLRILPSKWGRYLDPIADKVYAMSVFMGGIANGSVPLEQGAALIGMETATVGATAVATHQREGEPTEVGQVNKLGMIARMAAIAGYLGSRAAEHGAAHDIAAAGGRYGFLGAMALGAGGIINILRQGRQGPSEVPPEAVGPIDPLQ